MYCLGVIIEKKVRWLAAQELVPGEMRNRATCNEGNRKLSCSLGSKRKLLISEEAEIELDSCGSLGNMMNLANNDIHPEK